MTSAHFLGRKEGGQAIDRVVHPAHRYDAKLCHTMQQPNLWSSDSRAAALFWLVEAAAGFGCAALY